MGRGGGGVLWLFGGSGYDATGQIGPLSDLWYYDISRNVWVLIGGAAGTLSELHGVYPLSYGGLGWPSARCYASAWSTGGGLWLFGGWGFDAAGGM